MSNNYGKNFWNNLKDMSSYKHVMLGIIFFLIFAVGLSDKMIQRAVNVREEAEREQEERLLKEAEEDNRDYLVDKIIIKNHKYDKDNLIVKYSVYTNSDNIILVDHARLEVGSTYYELNPMNTPVLKRIDKDKCEYIVKYNISDKSNIPSMDSRNILNYHNVIEVFEKDKYEEKGISHYEDYTYGDAVQTKIKNMIEPDKEYVFEETLFNYIEGEREIINLNNFTITHRFTTDNISKILLYRIVKSPTGTRFQFYANHGNMFNDYSIRLEEEKYNVLIESKTEMMGLNVFEILVEEDISFDEQLVFRFLHDEYDPYVMNVDLNTVLNSDYEKLDIYNHISELGDLLIYNPETIQGYSKKKLDVSEAKLLPICEQINDEIVQIDQVYMYYIKENNFEDRVEKFRYNETAQNAYAPKRYEFIDSVTGDYGNSVQRQLFKGYFEYNGKVYFEDDIFDLMYSRVSHMDYNKYTKINNYEDIEVRSYTVDSFEKCFTKYYFEIGDRTYCIEAPNNIRTVKAVEEFVSKIKLANEL